MSSDKAQEDAAQDLEPLACVACRSRKLKCDRTRGICKRCKKVGAECVYPESRRKPTFKRRNVKELEARLAQVEDYLKEVNKGGEDVTEDAADEPNIQLGDFNVDAGMPSYGSEAQSHDTQSRDTPNQNPMQFSMPEFDSTGTFNFTGGELIELGMSEALPPFEVQEELNDCFFQFSHHFIPIVHPGRYFRSFYGNAVRKPPMCLQYAIWCMGAHMHEKYGQYADIFYKRARQYAGADEMKGIGEHFITIPHSQAWAIISSYEAKNMLFTRAAMSSARCIRLVDMMGLDRIDQEGLEIPPALGPPTSWVEIEERRRVFWGVFAIDCHASISTGWPSLIRLEDVVTRLPASEEAFLQGQEEETAFMEDVFNGATYAGFAGTLVVCQILKSIMNHVHRAKPSDRPEDFMNGPFWNRHRELDNKLSGAFMFLPEKFRLPSNARDPAAVHTNLNLHAAIICLHHTAIEKCDKHKLDESVKRNSISRLKTSAEEVANIVKMTAHQTSIFKSPLCALSMYCATTVYIYMAKYEDLAAEITSIDLANLELIIHAMEAVGRTHQMTRGFLQQACLDIERNDLKINIYIPGLGQYRDISNGICTNIPLLARGQVARHTDISPVLPGRLPLSKPKGSGRGMNGIADSSEYPALVSRKQKDLVSDLTNADCYSAMLGAVNRNVAGSGEKWSNKRRRMSASPGTDVVYDMGASVGRSDAEVMRGSPDMRKQYERMAPSLAAAGLWRAGGLTIRGGQPGSNSSASSPAVGTGSGTGSGTGFGTGTETQSGSSHTSPGWHGLGNTAEENRVDLRPFQDRIATPIWQQTEEVFLNMSESMASGALPNDGSDPWAFLTGDVNLDWDALPGATADQPLDYEK